jgi:hypothetical protein
MTFLRYKDLQAPVTTVFDKQPSKQQQLTAISFSQQYHAVIPTFLYTSPDTDTDRGNLKCREKKIKNQKIEMTS